MSDQPTSDARRALQERHRAAAERSRLLEQHPTWSQCTACGRTFTSDSAFAAHMDSEVSRTCHDPATVRSGDRRLIHDDEYGAWRWQTGDTPPARRKAPPKPARTSQEPRTAASAGETTLW